jgi:RNA polymerase sigma-70 factor (ECF subfamily)
VEQELVEAARRGDRVAYDALVRRKADAVYRTAFAILGSDADAQDATQEAFVAAWRGLASLRDADRFDAWLGRITMNACRMALRRRAKVHEIPIEGLADTRGTAGDPGLASTMGDADAFDRAFGRLTVDERAILVFRHRDDLAVDEIAARLGVPAGTVKSRLHRARAALERALARENR